MIDEILEIVEIAADIGEAMLEKRKKERQEAEDGTQRKEGRERPL